MMEFVYSTNDLKPDPCSDFFINFASSNLQETLYSIDSEKDKINFSDQAGHCKLKFVHKDLTLKQYKTLSDQYMKENFYKSYENKSKSVNYYNR